MPMTPEDLQRRLDDLARQRATPQQNTQRDLRALDMGAMEAMARIRAAQQGGGGGMPSVAAMPTVDPGMMQGGAPGQPPMQPPMQGGGVPTARFRDLAAYRPPTRGY